MVDVVDAEVAPVSDEVDDDDMLGEYEVVDVVEPVAPPVREGLSEDD